MILDHVALIVYFGDSLRFYEKLRFKKAQRFMRYYDTIIFMECGGVALDIFISS